MKEAIAILTSDWHIWGTAPLYRADEPDWFKAMERPLRAIKRFQKQNGDIPVIIAGDIFDFYNPPPATVNWLMRKMPRNVYAIPGQHDLQNHKLDLIEKSGFWTLVEGGKITYLNPDFENTVEVKGFEVKIVSKPWNYEPAIPEKGDVDILLYVAHQYIYSNQQNCYIGADEKGDISKQQDFLNEVDVAVFGDNHIPFNYTLKNSKKTKIVNCGTLLRRKVDERQNEIGFTVLYSDCSVEKILFDTDKDIYSVITGKKKDDTQEEKTAELLKELEQLDTISFNFEDEINRYLNKEKRSKNEKNIVTEIISKYKENAK